MPKVSAKRQITLPKSLCLALGIEPGNQVEIFVANGQMTIIKKLEGAAKGLLKQLPSDASQIGVVPVQSSPSDQPSPSHRSTWAPSQRNKPSVEHRSSGFTRTTTGSGVGSMSG